MCQYRQFQWFLFFAVTLLVCLLIKQSHTFADDTGMKASMKIVAKGMNVADKIKDMIAVAKVTNPATGKSYEMQMCQKIDSDSESRGIVIIEKPDNLKGMTLLFQYTQDNPPSQWIYVPKTSRSRQVPSIDQASFLDMNINFEDLQFMNLAKIDDALFRILAPEKVNGKQCAVIEKIYDDTARFKRQVLYISEDPVFPVKIDAFEKNDELKMTFIFKDIKIVQEIPTPGIIEFIDQSNKQNIVFTIQDIKYNNDIENTFFRLDDLKTASMRMAKLWRKASK